MDTRRAPRRIGAKQPRVARGRNLPRVGLRNKETRRKRVPRERARLGCFDSASPSSRRIQGRLESGRINMPGSWDVTPHNNNKNPSARLRPAARRITSSPSLGRDSAGRSHVITAAGASSQITRAAAADSFERSARSFRSPSSPASPSTTSIDLPSVCPILRRYSASSCPAPPHSPRTPIRAPFPGAHVYTRQVFRLRRASIAFPHVFNLLISYIR